MTNRLPTIFAVLIVLVFFLCPQTFAEIIDRIVAAVNGEIITLREVDKKVERYKKVTDPAQHSDIQTMRRTVLEIMINRLLTIQEGTRLGIKIDEQQITDTIEQIKRENNLTEAQLVTELAKQGGTLEELKEDVYFDLIRGRVIRYDLGAHIVITDRDIANYLNTGGTSYSPTADPTMASPAATRAHLRHIFISSNQKNLTQKQALAKQIVSKIRGGLDFTQAAAQYSEAPNATQGGDLGWLALRDLNRQLRSTIQSLQPGQVSQPLLTDNGIQIFQLVSLDTGNSQGKKPGPNNAGSPPLNIPEEEKERIRQKILEERVQEKFDAWLKELRNKAIIRINL